MKSISAAKEKLESLKREIERTEKMYSQAQMIIDENMIKVRETLKKKFKFESVLIEPNSRLNHLRYSDDIQKEWSLNVSSEPRVDFEIVTNRSRENFKTGDAAQRWATKLQEKWSKVGVPNSSLYFPAYNVTEPYSWREKPRNTFRMTVTIKLKDIYGEI